MKTLKLIPLATLLLLLLSVASLSAQQNTLPDPHDNSCWSSLDALRACQLKAYNEAQDYAQRCSSYPEYQCNDYYQPEQPKTSQKHANKAVAQSSNSASSTAVNQNATSGANLRAANSTK